MEEKRENKKEKILWLIIVALLIALIAQNCASRYIYRKTDDQIKTGPPGAEEFFQSWAWPLKQEEPKPAGKVGLAVPAGVVADKDGNAVVIIRNQGDQPAVPVVKFRGREVYRCSRALGPGEAVKAKVAFGPGSGTERFEVLLEAPEGKGLGVGMSVISKVTFQN
ncbi:MAG: hypothetical protein K6U04_08630 [Armatimonadetes bacterium]|nr:hypothetical protein [Armatimonadota bacterium]